MLGTLLIKAGKKFGGEGGGYFDDSSSSSFTCSHYLNGVVKNIDNNGVIAYQFLYLSSHDNQSRIESIVHGNKPEKINVKPFLLNEGERINKVQIHVINHTFPMSDGSRFPTKIVNEVIFFTTKNRQTPSNFGHIGEMFTESFDGYTLGYITEKAGTRIDQLQFFWYRNSQIE